MIKLGRKGKCNSALLDLLPCATNLKQCLPVKPKMGLHLPNLMFLSCTTLHNSPSGPPALLSWSHHLSGCKEGMQQGFSLFWHQGGKMNFRQTFEQLSLSVFEGQLKDLPLYEVLNQHFLLVFFLNPGLMCCSYHTNLPNRVFVLLIPDLMKQYEDVFIDGDLQTVLQVALGKANDVNIYLPLLPVFCIDL